MAVIKKGQWKAPFFGKSNDYSTGRDSLGLQTTSQASYSSLLPGLTNLTNRIRYYGFYCWLLEIYAKQVGDTSQKTQNQFVRRAEYMIALIMKSENDQALQIPGSSFASEEFNNRSQESSYDLSFGADIETGKNTYWKYSSGAFGQYYSGAMQTIGLIIHRDDSPVFVCTDIEDESIVSGTRLAKAFDKNITEKAKNIFIKNIEQHSLNKADIELLFNDFTIIDIPRQSDEWLLYQQMIFSNDQPLIQNPDNKTFFRRDTFSTVLSYINQVEDPKQWDMFTCELYKTKGVDFYGKETKSSYGWYYYQLNEYWHFGVETIFWSMLETLSIKYSQVPLPNLITEFHQQMIDSIIGNSLAKDEKQPFGDIIESLETEDVWNISEKIDEAVKNNDIKTALYYGVRLLFSIYKENLSEFDKLKKFASYYRMERNGDCVHGLEEFNLQIKISISETLKKFLLKNVINRHLEVAYRKMGSGVKNTLKFSYEDNNIKHIETIRPVWTTPRIYAMYRFFEDLGYIDSKGNLNSIGYELIKTA